MVGVGCPGGRTGILVGGCTVVGEVGIALGLGPPGPVVGGLSGDAERIGMTTGEGGLAVVLFPEVGGREGA